MCQRTDLSSGQMRNCRSRIKRSRSPQREERRGQSASRDGSCWDTNLGKTVKITVHITDTETMHRRFLTPNLLPSGVHFHSQPFKSSASVCGSLTHMQLLRICNVNCSTVGKTKTEINWKWNEYWNLSLEICLPCNEWQQCCYQILK